LKQSKGQVRQIYRLPLISNDETVTENHIQWQKPLVSRAERESRNRHKSFILWFTGFSGAGKSTLARAVERRLFDLDRATFVLDGDNVRHGLCSDLGFSQKDREENIRRIGEVAKLFTEAGIISINAFISPFRADRDRIRTLVAPEDFIEIYCYCPIEVCKQRDVKGLYTKAKKGLIPEFTGITSLYEPPQNPEIFLDTSAKSLNECVDQILVYLEKHLLVNANNLQSGKVSLVHSEPTTGFDI
jgi:adenylylsulfate kinase